MSRIRCPICDVVMDNQGPKEWPDWPFCSPRCKTIDLGRWLSGNYALPAQPDPEEDAEESGA